MSAIERDAGERRAADDEAAEREREREASRCRGGRGCQR